MKIFLHELQEILLDSRIVLKANPFAVDSLLEVPLSFSSVLENSRSLFTPDNFLVLGVVLSYLLVYRFNLLCKLTSGLVGYGYSKESCFSRLFKDVDTFLFSHYGFAKPLAEFFLFIESQLK